MSDRPQPSAFDELRTQLVAAAEHDNAAAQSKATAWWRRMRLPVIAVVVGLGATTAGVATYFTGSGDPLPVERGLRGASAAAGVLIDSAAPDPIAAAPAWVLRLSTDKQGRDCIELGRLKGGVFGQMTGRLFRSQPQSSGLCAVLTDDPLLVSVSQRAEPPRTVVYGLTRDRTPVTIRLGGATRRLRPRGPGAFIGVLDSAPDLTGATVTTQARDGGSITRRLG